jgi:acyl-CoA thioester hydrolase
MKEIKVYKHVVQYYETDMMGFAHHSNYIRWMEESRTDFLCQLNLDYARLEKEGIVSPTVEVNCKYKKSTTFQEVVFITVSLVEFKGVKLKFRYIMKNAQGEIVAEASSVHCLLDKTGKPIRFAKEYPEYYGIIMDNIVPEEKI